MKLKQRILVELSLFFWGVILFWFWGSLIFFLLPVLGLVFVIIGGKIHV